MASWRDTYKKPRLFFIDARIAYIIIPVLVYIRIWTILLVCAVATILYLLEVRRGLDIAAAGRALRWWLAGDYRPARNPARWRTRHAADRQV